VRRLLPAAQRVVVSSSFGLATRLFGLGGVGITGGLILIPLIIGVAMIFYNARSALGWLLAIGSLAGLIFGVIASLSLNLRTMTAFELIGILVLAFGGLGLFLRSLRGSAREEPVAPLNRIAPSAGPRPPRCAGGRARRPMPTRPNEICARSGRPPLK
jgi:hypothetical protein